MNPNRSFESGELVFASQQGNYNIFYPLLEKRVLIVASCEAEQMSWYDLGGKRAYKIPTECVREKDRYNDGSSFMVIWK